MRVTPTCCVSASTAAPASNPAKGPSSGERPAPCSVQRCCCAVVPGHLSSTTLWEFMDLSCTGITTICVFALCDVSGGRRLRAGLCLWWADGVG